MLARLYKGRNCAGYVDEYSLYFRYPNWLRKEQRGAAGCYLGCSVASDGTMIRCNWGEVEIFSDANLGKKVDISTMPMPFRREVERMEALYNEALKTRNFDRWNVEA